MANNESTSLKVIEIIAVVAAAVIAGAALYASIQQARSTQEHNKLSVRPAVFFHSHWSPESDFLGLQMYNHGLGPAIIHPIEIYIDGKLVNDWGEAIKILEIDNTDDWVTWFAIDKVPFGGGMPLRSEAVRRVFGLSINEEDDKPERRKMIINVLPRINLAVCFCSMYDECREVFYGEYRSGACSRIHSQ